MGAESADLFSDCWYLKVITDDGIIIIIIIMIKIVVIIMAIKGNYEESVQQMNIWLLVSAELAPHYWHSFNCLFENHTY
jgi:hypothetical protein